MMSESKYPRTYYGYQSGITGFCYLVWHSEANDCDVPAPEGDYVRESDYAELRNEWARLVWSLEKASEVMGALEMMDGPDDDSDWRIWAGGYIRSMIDGLKTACAALNQQEGGECDERT